MYTYMDGDSVGFSLNRLFEQGRSKEAALLSENITKAIFQIGSYIRSQDSIELIIAGGDDVLFKTDEDQIISVTVARVKALFAEMTGLNMSHGTGLTIQSALEELDTAKKVDSRNIYKSDRELKKSTLNTERRTDLRIIVGSKVPDLYINVLGHCIAHFPIDSVTLYQISEDRGKDNIIRHNLELLKSKIGKQLSSITESKYPKRLDSGEFEEIDLKLLKPEKERYETISKVILDLDVIPYEQLDRVISSWISGDNPKQQIVDVSGTLKSSLVDVYSICRFRDLESIFSFELLTERRSYDEKELIHNLTSCRSYTYNCLALSNYTSGTTVLNESSIAKNSQVLRNEAVLESQLPAFRKLKVDVAESYAKGLFVIFGLVVGLLLLASYGVIFLHPEGWDFVEPMEYVVGSLAAFTFVMYAILKRGTKRPLTAFGLYERFKTSKLRRLDEEYGHELDQ